MAVKISRREAREHLLGLIYETEFRADEEKEVIFETSSEEREIPDDAFIKKLYFGICDKLEEIDALIAKHSVGWKTERMSRVSRAVLRLGVYELVYMSDIPSSVSINEAIELTKKYDDEKARAFVNGILNAVKNEVGEKK
ncbi:MAG: transcription antitermination factor NusB [Ruminococcaceae bacterium]|nr:transcription antitermination factor NusB [Oscillospiraceae bacterium]